MGAVLTLDLGTSTGWALQLPDGRLSHGHVSFERAGHERDGAQFLRFRAWLAEQRGRVTAAGGEISLVLFEDVNFIPPRSGYRAVHSWGGFWALLLAWCVHHGFDYRPVHVSTLKKAATGNHRAKKPEVIAAVQAAGHLVTNDDEADALALMLFLAPPLAPQQRAAA